MAKRRSSPQPPGPPTIDAATALRLLKQQAQTGTELLAARPLSSDDHSAWELKTKNYLERAFGLGSDNVSSVTDVGKYGSFPMSASPEWWEDHRAQSLKRQIKTLGALSELLETEVELSQGPGPKAIPVAPPRHGIFLVHGHDDAVLHATARFLERLRQKVTILREEPDQGRTIIEKFEDYADVGFAVVLLTPDDRGGPRDTAFEGQRPRARQNVVLELGYFLGRLGRRRVCALFREGLDIPSDYAGVLYIPFDVAGAWRLSLARELKAAQLEVDLNLAV